MYITLTYNFDGEKYDYEVSLSHEIVYDWFKHLVGNSFVDAWEKPRQQGFERCFDLLWQEDVFNVDYFINNEDFLNWLANREINNAKEEYENQL